MTGWQGSERAVTRSGVFNLEAAQSGCRCLPARAMKTPPQENAQHWPHPGSACWKDIGETGALIAECRFIALHTGGILLHIRLWMFSCIGFLPWPACASTCFESVAPLIWSHPPLQVRMQLTYAAFNFELL